MEAAGSVGALLVNVTAPAYGGYAGPAAKGQKTFHLHLQGDAGAAVSSTVKLWVSNFNPAVYASSWVLAATFVVSGTSVITDGLTVEGPWAYWRAEVTAIAGTNATLNLAVKQ